MFGIAVIVLLAIIAFAVAPDIMAALTGLGCIMALVVAGLAVVLFVLIMAGVIQ